MDIINTTFKEMAEAVVDWYGLYKRDLPWRRTKDPYAIWISEIMLQQTQVDTVIPYFLNFMERFPTVSDLAEAELEAVYKAWEGLGYYRRAAHLKEAAQMIMDVHDGHFPEDFDDILKLKGIGMYTACAISSIAFGKPRGVIDGNTLRIIARIMKLEDNIAVQKTRNDFQKIMDALILYEDPSDFNQAMMDIGATVCTPLHPKCDRCPLSGFCLAHKNECAERLPVNIKKINKSEIRLITAILQYKDRYMLIRNEKGLLENLYGFVQFECESPSEYESLFKERYGVDVWLKGYIKDIKHVFTHRTWHMHVYYGELEGEVDDLVEAGTFEQLPISTAHMKVLKAYLKQMEGQS